MIVVVGLSLILLVFTVLIALAVSEWYQVRFPYQFNVYSEKDKGKTFNCSSGCHGQWNEDWYPIQEIDGSRYCPNCTGAD